MPLALLALAACLVDHTPAVDDACTTCVVEDDNQFSYTTRLSIVNFELAARQDAEIRWSDLEFDVHGHAFDAAEVQMAYLVVLRNMRPDEVVAAIEADTLRQPDVTAYLSCEPVDDACRLSKFGNMGNSAHADEYFAEGSGTWLVVLTSAVERGAVAVALLEPSAGGGGTAALVEPSSRASVNVDFGSLSPLRPRASLPEILLDWSSLDVDGLGQPLRPETVTELFIGRYDEPRSELEGSLFDLSEAAVESWTMALGGSDWANLAGLRGSTPFEGVSPGSTWLAAMLSDNGLVLTPKVVTFLDPVSDP